MATEIELKYLVNDTGVVDKFNALLKKHNFQYTHHSRQLNNTYFDTQDRKLRALDFGLRVRKADDYTEQTIKTAGIVTGGLHQRPEYNVAITASTPDLTQFPQEIWPDDIAVSTLQQELLSIFSTNFQRESWQVTVGGSVVEVAFDNGVIESQGQELAINEIELELVNGKTEAIFELAKLLFEQFHLSAGQLSKAARGYQLWQLNQATEQEQQYIPFLNLTHEMSVEGVMVVGIEQGLNALQKAIAATLAETSLSKLQEVYQVLSFIQHGLFLYQDYIEGDLQSRLNQLLKAAIDNLSWLESAATFKQLTSKTGNYRKKIEYSQQLLQLLKIERNRVPQEQEIKQLLTGELFNTLQLELLQFVLSPVVKPSEKTLLLEDFSQKALEQSLDAIVSVSHNKAQLTKLEYLVMQHHLSSSLLTGNWFSSLFEQYGRKEYRRIWFDVLHGIEELATLDLLQKQLDVVESDVTKLANWLDRKIENLLLAIEQSYQSAIRVEPYWR